MEILNPLLRATRSRVDLLVSVVAAAIFSGNALAVTPRDAVLRLVPKDAGFCLIVQNLRPEARAFAESPFYEQFRASAFGQELLQSPGVRKLAGLEEHLEKHLGLNRSRIRDDLIGDVLVFAYRPPPVVGAGGDHGLILLHARDARVLSELIARLNEAQQASGEVTSVEARDCAGVRYYCRNEASRKQFYYLHGPLLALTSQEEVIRAVIDRERRADQAEARFVRQFRRLGAEAALAALLVNPRAFDGELKKKMEVAKGADGVVLGRIMDYWKAVDGIALTATVEKASLEIGVTFVAREGELPAAARRFFAVTESPSELWGHFPEDAMLAMAGRLDAVELTTVLGEFLPPEARFAIRQAVNHEFGAVLGLDIVQDVLPNIGPDWGLCVSGSSAPASSALPSVIMALRVRPGNAPKPVDRALIDGLRSFAAFVVFSYNKAHDDAIRLETTLHDQIEVQYLRNDKLFPLGWRPAFALKAGYLLLATSPDAVRQFHSVPGSVGRADGEIPLLHVSVRRCRSFFKDRQDALARRMAAEHGIPVAEAAKRLGSLYSLSTYFERLDLVRQSGAGKVALVLRVRTERPLKK